MRVHRAGQCLLMGVALAASPPLYAQVHARIDPSGRLQVSTTAQPGSVAFDPHRAREGERRRPPPGPHVRQRRWAPLVEQVAHEYGLEAGLLHAIIQVESGYNPTARSRAGAVGLMQVIPETGRRFGAQDLLDPSQNLRAGAAYLTWLMQRFEGELPLVLAAYNAGEGAVQRHGNRIPPFAETRTYVRRVTELYDTAAR